MKYVALLVLLCSLSVARAQGIVLESYTGRRPDDMTRMLSPLHEELAGRGYTTGDTLARRYETTVSRPAQAKDGMPSDFEDRIERGHKAWIAGRFDEAVSILVPIVDAAHANAGAFAQSQTLRNKLLKGLIALALSQQRRGDLAAAKETLAEVRRSFPDTQLSRAQYGPDAYELFEEVRRTQGQGGRGRLKIDVSAESSVVFVNEHFENVGRVAKDDVIPGDYRIYAQMAQQLSRVHRVAVRADETASLSIDMRFDAVLHTSPAWIGFEFAGPGDRARDEATYALKVARETKAKGLIVVGIDHTNGRPSLIGVLLDLRAGREIRRASLALEPEPSAERVRSLARFLAGEEPVEGIDVLVQEVAATAGDEPKARDDATSAPSDRRWMLWTGIAAIGVGLGGGVLAIKFVGDAHDAGDELQRVCAVSCPGEQARSLESKQDRANRNAVISGVAGGVVAAAGVVFIIISQRSSSAPSVAFVPVNSGAVATYSLAF